MRYLHTLDPDEIRELDEYWESVKELEEEDRSMEKYYKEKYNTK